MAPRGRRGSTYCRGIMGGWKWVAAFAILLLIGRSFGGESGFACRFYCTSYLLGLRSWTEGVECGQGWRQVQGFGKGGDTGEKEREP